MCESTDDQCDTIHKRALTLTLTHSLTICIFVNSGVWEEQKSRKERKKEKNWEQFKERQYWKNANSEETGVLRNSPSSVDAVQTVLEILFFYFFMFYFLCLL